MNSRKRTALFIFVGILILVFILLFFLSRSANSQQAAASSPAAAVPDSTVASAASTTTAGPIISTAPPPADTPKYKNGTYTAVGRYDSPAGAETIDVSVTLSNDIVTDSSVTPLAGDGRSMSYQEMFITAYKQYVIGKSIDSIILSAISGSSLTPHGFNNALTAIKSEALAS